MLRKRKHDISCYLYARCGRRFIIYCVASSRATAIARVTQCGQPVVVGPGQSPAASIGKRQPHALSYRRCAPLSTAQPVCVHCKEFVTRDPPNVYLSACGNTTSTTIIIIILNKKRKKSTITNDDRCGGYHCLFNCSTSFGLCFRLVVTRSVSPLALRPDIRCTSIVFLRAVRAVVCDPSPPFRFRFSNTPVRF